MSYVGIEENTDMRYRNTKVVRLSSLAAVKRFLDKPKALAFPGAADESLPGSQQNWHHRIRSAYEMPPGWRVSQREVNELVARWRDSVYRKTAIQAKADLIRRDGKEVSP